MALLEQIPHIRKDDSGGLRITQVYAGTESEVQAASAGIVRGAGHGLAAGEVVYSYTVSRELGAANNHGGKWLLTIESGSEEGFVQTFPRPPDPPPNEFPRYSAGSVDGQRPIVSCIDSGYAPPLIQWIAEPNPLLKKAFKFRSENGGIESLANLSGGSKPPLVELAKWILLNGATIPATDHSIETEYEDADLGAANGHTAGMMKVDKGINHPLAQGGFEYLKKDCRIVEHWKRDETTGQTTKVYRTTVRWLGRPKWLPVWLYDGTMIGG